MQGGTRLDVGRGHAQASHVGRHGVGIEARNLGGRPPLGQPLANDLVVDIGDVVHIAHVKAARAQVAHDHVERNRSARVTNVAEIVHGHAADVDGDLARLERLEFHLLLGPGVVQTNHDALRLADPAAQSQEIDYGKAEQESGDDERLEMLARPLAFEKNEGVVGDLDGGQGADALDLGDREGL